MSLAVPSRPLAPGRIASRATLPLSRSLEDDDSGNHDSFLRLDLGGIVKHLL